MEFLPNDVIENIFVGMDSGSEVQIRTFWRHLGGVTTEAMWINHMRNGVLNQFTFWSSSSMFWHAIKIRAIRPAGNTPYETWDFAPLIGKIGIASGPHQVAGIFTLRVKSEGSRRDGRMYMPATPCTYFQNGAWTQDAINAGANVIGQMKVQYTKTGTHPNIRQLVRGTNVGGATEYFTVTDYKFQSMPGVIRRRRRETI